MIVALIILAALACLGTGVFTGEAILTWIAIALCVIGGTILIVPWVLARRKPAAANQPDGAAVAKETDDDQSGAETVTDGPARRETAIEDRPEALATDGPEQASTAATPGEPPVKEQPESPEPEPAKEHTPSAPATPSMSLTTTVLTIPGRCRYHMAGCRLVAGHDDTEELTLAEAREEGFTRCTACSEDAASKT